ncbi:MAG: hypothetical protein IKS12_02125 [Eubacterium sp.]|nr:hypothetical protein [Eubacterium sp.]MBR7073311.1 hypothetical protein [Eubacterium sp.]
MAKVKAKSGLAKANKVLFFIFLALLIATVVIIIFSKPKVAEVPADAAGAATEDVAKIDEFVAGTYGGKDFQSVDDVVKYYVEVFDYNKTLTANYKENGETKTYYKLLGDENLSVENLLIEGKSNSMINNLVPGILGGIFKGNVKGLPPSDNRDPNLDTRDDGKIDERHSHLTADDVLAANVKDNGDGTITIQIQPKAVILSMPDADAQGRFFNVLGDISGTVESISVLSFASGTIDENFVVNYQGGVGTIKIDTKTNEVIEADYEMDVHIDVKHANVAVIKDKNASLDIIYTNHFPASDDYLKEMKGITR